MALSNREKKPWAPTRRRMGRDTQSLNEYYEDSIKEMFDDAVEIMLGDVFRLIEKGESPESVALGVRPPYSWLFSKMGEALSTAYEVSGDDSSQAAEDAWHRYEEHINAMIRVYKPLSTTPHGAEFLRRMYAKQVVALEILLEDKGRDLLGLPPLEDGWFGPSEDE